MEVWLPDTPARASVGALPETVEVHLIPRRGVLPPEFERVEFLVPPFGSRRVIEALPRLSALRVIIATRSGLRGRGPQSSTDLI